LLDSRETIKGVVSRECEKQEFGGIFGLIWWRERCLCGQKRILDIVEPLKNAQKAPNYAHFYTTYDHFYTTNAQLMTTFAHFFTQK